MVIVRDDKTPSVSFTVESATKALSEGSLTVIDLRTRRLIRRCGSHPMDANAPGGAPPADKSYFVAKWFKRLVGLAGLVFGAIAPKLTAPVNLTLPFAVSSRLLCLLGFAVMYAALAVVTANPRNAAIVAILSGVLSTISSAIYLTLLYSPSEGTPGMTVEWVEFILFCSAYFGIGIVIAYVYKNGGNLLIRKIYKLPSNGT